MLISERLILLGKLLTNLGIAASNLKNKHALLLRKIFKEKPFIIHKKTQNTKQPPNRTNLTLFF